MGEIAAREKRATRGQDTCKSGTTKNTQGARDMSHRKGQDTSRSETTWKTQGTGDRKSRETEQTDKCNQDKSREKGRSKSEVPS